jgi:hypothetical protein
MQEGRGRTFDPQVLDAFFRIGDTVQEIAARFSDETEVAEGPQGLTARLLGSPTGEAQATELPVRVTPAMARVRAL